MYNDTESKDGIYVCINYCSYFFAVKCYNIILFVPHSLLIDKRFFRLPLHKTRFRQLLNNFILEVFHLVIFSRGYLLKLLNVVAGLAAIPPIE